MTDDIYANVGTPTVINRAFVALAVEAGIETVIKSLIGMWGMDLRSLLLKVKEALSDSNAPLASALNADNLAAILDYMSRAEGGIVPMVNTLPLALPMLENVAGPASVSAAFDGGVTEQVNVSIPEAGDPATWTQYEIYVDGVFWKTGTNSPSAGWINDSVQGVPTTAQTIRVLFARSEDGQRYQTQFGPIATLT